MNLSHPASIARLSEPDDDELARAAQRDPSAFGPLYDRYVHGLYRYVLTKVGTPMEAEDVTSRAFLSALEALPRYQPRGRFAAWLFTIARRKILDHFRRHEPPEPPAEEDLRLPASLEQPVGPEDRERLRSVLRGLSEDRQELIRLRYVAGLPFRQIAVMVGKREDAVKKIVYRALAHVRAELEGDDA